MVRVSFMKDGSVAQGSEELLDRWRLEGGDVWIGVSTG